MFNQFQQVIWNAHIVHITTTCGLNAWKYGDFLIAEHVINENNKLHINTLS